jgi:hypothetical protein
MFARKVTARLQKNSLTTFVDLMDHEILPWLRKQEGFQDLITLVAPDGLEVTTITFWDHERNAQTYDEIGYPAALKMVGDLLDGEPYVKVFNLLSSTFHGSVPQSPPQDQLVSHTASA